MRTLRRLQEYNYFEGTADKGSGVREKSKQLIDLLGSNETIRSEREKAKRLKNKFTGVGSDGGSYGNSGSYGGGGDTGRYDSGRYDSGRNESYSGGGSGGRRESYSSGGNGSGISSYHPTFDSIRSLSRW
jgi:epsin